MFSVSEVESKSKNKNSAAGNKQYMDYFEEFNKEID